MDLQKAFELNEIVHEQDILVKEGTNVVFVGQGVTADNIFNTCPTLFDSRWHT